MHKSCLFFVINRTVEEFQKGHVDAEKIINIPYMFNTPEGKTFVTFGDMNVLCLVVIENEFYN